MKIKFAIVFYFISTINISNNTFTFSNYNNIFIDYSRKELFKHTSKVRNECVEAFEKAKIFDGKTIYEAEKDIEVLFG